MRIKRMTVLLMLFLLIAASSFSLTVFAEPVDETTAPAVSESDSEQDVRVTEQPTQTLSPNAITPSGQGSVLNYYENDNDDKQFYTITTPAGNVFYLVVDGARGYENVYFLNAVTETDLMALAAENDKITINSVSTTQTCTCTEKCENGKVNEDCPVCRADIGKCTGTVRSSTSDETEAESGGNTEKNNNNSNLIMYGIIAAAFIAVAGIGIYVKIIRPKKEHSSFEDEEESESVGEHYASDEYGSPDYLPEDDYDDE